MIFKKEREKPWELNWQLPKNLNTLIRTLKYLLDLALISASVLFDQLWEGRPQISLVQHAYLILIDQRELEVKRERMVNWGMIGVQRTGCEHVTETVHSFPGCPDTSNHRNHTKTMLITTLLGLLAQASYELTLTSQINPFLLIYVSPRGCGLLVRFSSIFLLRHLTDSAYSLSTSLFRFTAWFCSAKLLTKTASLSTNKSNTYTERYPTSEA